MCIGEKCTCFNCVDKICKPVSCRQCKEENSPVFDDCHGKETE